MEVREIKGNLITLAEEGEFDVIVHGCNCFCTMGAGIAPQMAKAFHVDQLPMENPRHKGKINKLGTIDWGVIPTTEEFKKLSEGYGVEITPKHLYQMLRTFDANDIIEGLIVVNAYTQYGFGANHSNGTTSPIDYEALTLVMRKMNYEFKDMHIGLPWIGAGLAGGDWNRIREIILTELKDCDVTLIEYDGSR